MIFELPPLAHPTDAFEPHLSRETLDIHHGRHHAAYVKALNELVRGTSFADRSLVEIIALSEPGPLHNNAAQHFNHSFYWNCLRPPGGKAPTGALSEKIRKGFGGFDELTRRFGAAAAGQFGSGWAWLVLNADGSLTVEASTNAASPVETGRKPLLACDVWEHAYYIDYRSDRGKYVESFWKLVNWDFVAANLTAGDAVPAMAVAG
jgi:superoxide dismutase, Fe-Mn family